MGFYTPEEEQARVEYLPVMRKQILEKLDDLIEKIEKNEPFPESEQNVDNLCDIHDLIEQCLNNWYY